MPESIKVESISGVRKAAILILALPKETAARVLSSLDKSSIEQIGLEIAKIEAVDPNEQKAVLEEFYNLTLAQTYIEQGGIEYARKLLEAALPIDEARRVIEIITQTLQSEPFDFLRKAPLENLLPFIHNEHPQTIALILAHLPSSKSAEVLSALPAEKKVEVVKRLATIERTSPEVIAQIEKVLEKKFSVTFTETIRETEGVKLVSEILNKADRATEKSILESLEEENPELADNIRRLMFVFEDIILVDDRGIQNLLKEINVNQLALALKVSSDELKNKFLKNMSKRAGELLKEEMEYMGPVRLSEVEAAQRAIVEKVRALEEAGQAYIQGRGGADQIIM